VQQNLEQQQLNRSRVSRYWREYETLEQESEAVIGGVPSSRRCLLFTFRAEGSGWIFHQFFLPLLPLLLVPSSIGSPHHSPALLPVCLFMHAKISYCCEADMWAHVSDPYVSYHCTIMHGCFVLLGKIVPLTTRQLMG
jgi:hypothetical protein